MSHLSITSLFSRLPLMEGDMKSGFLGRITTLHSLTTDSHASSSVYRPVPSSSMQPSTTTCMSSYMEDDPDFTKFLSSIYVDDIISGAADVDSAYTLYLKSRLRLATAGFRLRKFKTNSQELQTRIQQNEQTIVAEGTTEITKDKETGSGEETGSRSTNQEPITEGTQHIHVEDQSYAKIVLGNNCVTRDSTKSHKVL